MSRPPDPQSPPTAAHATASRLIARELAGAPAPAAHDAREVASAGERLIDRVTEGLSRSFGPYGALALVSRALARAQGNHPMLATVTVMARTAVSPAGAPDRSGSVGGLAASARAAGGPATLHGLTAWLTELADLLGGLIGDDLAATLLEQNATSGTARPPLPGGTFAAAPDAGDTSRPHGTDDDAQSRVERR
jgi:hypothetical protein